jgi:hypothetical protein
MRAEALSIDKSDPGEVAVSASLSPPISASPGRAAAIHVFR